MPDFTYSHGRLVPAERFHMDRTNEPAPELTTTTADTAIATPHPAVIHQGAPFDRSIDVRTFRTLAPDERAAIKAASPAGTYLITVSAVSKATVKVVYHTHASVDVLKTLAPDIVAKLPATAATFQIPESQPASEIR